MPEPALIPADLLGRMSHQCPASRGMARPRTASLSFPPSPLWIDQRTKIFKAVCCDKAARGKLPQGVFYLAWKPVGSPDEIAEKLGAAHAEGIQHLASGVRQVGNFGAAVVRADQPVGILPQEKRNRCNTGRTDAP